MRVATFALAFITLAQGVAAADEFEAWVFLVEGNTISFVKRDYKKKGPPEVPPTTLTAADNVQVLQGSPNPETKKYEGAIVESGLDYPLFKKITAHSKDPKKGRRYHLTTLVTNSQNRITEIRLNNDLAAKIVKVKDDVIKVIQLPGGGFYGGKVDSLALEYRLPDNAKIVKGWLNPETKKFEGTPVEGGLKNKIFDFPVRARVTFDDNAIILIRVFDPAKIPANKVGNGDAARIPGRE
jgi:hypothetical protein